MARSRFHQHLVETWPWPRPVGDCFVHNFGSERDLVAITFKGGYYELCWWSHDGTGVADEEHVGLLETGSIAIVCSEAEDFMRTTLHNEGRDPDDFV